jgi:hypothetical protein
MKRIPPIQRWRKICFNERQRFDMAVHEGVIGFPPVAGGIHFLFGVSQ